MSLLYEPKGKAREYSPLALNITSGGCPHGCDYCYCKGVSQGRWGLVPKVRNMSALDREAEMVSRQILLSFMGDPYSQDMESLDATRSVLSVLCRNRCSVAVLTKGGTRCLRDLATFQSWPDGRIKIGATLTFWNPETSALHEPGAATPQDRVSALKALHEAGIKTWASIEPVIDPVESLEVIRQSLPYVDAYKVGKLNHRKNDTDWSAFGLASVDMIRKAGRGLYVKDDLRPYLPAGYLTESECNSECNSESLTLPDRPNERDLFA